MSNPDKLLNDRYKRLYFKFLKLEIPNFIQIIGLLSFFSYLSQDIILNFLIILIVCLLLKKYFFEKFFEFMEGQIVSPYSELNRHQLDDHIWMEKYSKWIKTTLLLLFILVNIISLSLYYLK